MIAEVQRLLDEYVAWLKDKTTLRQVGDWVEITTPYLDRHNDYLQIYAKREDGGYLLTDDGYTIEDLEQSGCSLDSEKRKALLRTTLNGFGVNLDGSALVVRTSREAFASHKHNLVQSMLAVNDLFYLAAPTVATLFYEDVVAWLDRSEIRYSPKVKFTGRSGYDHLFDFLIPKSPYQPERIARAVSNPNRDAAQSLAFAWLDIREVRPPEAKAYALLNDADRPVSSAVSGALRNYGVTPLPWSQRAEYREELAA